MHIQWEVISLRVHTSLADPGQPTCVSINLSLWSHAACSWIEWHNLALEAAACFCCWGFHGPVSAYCRDWYFKKYGIKLTGQVLNLSLVGFLTSVLYFSYHPVNDEVLELFNFKSCLGYNYIWYWKFLSCTTDCSLHDTHNDYETPQASS